MVPRAGWAEHNADEDWWGDFVFITRKLLADSRIDPKEIKAIGCSAIGPCMLPVDADGNALMNGVLYGVDNRAAAEVDELTATSVKSSCSALWQCADLAVGGAENSVAEAQSSGPVCPHRKDTHVIDLYRSKADRRTVIDHYTAANFSPLYDIETQDWTTELTDKIVDRIMLPEILWSSEIAGGHAEAARTYGAGEGTPVLTGTIDAAAEAISVGVASPGEMMIMYGSTIFIIMPTAERVADPRLVVCALAV